MERLIAAMIRYDSGDPQRIHHFLKVHAFARQIGSAEKLDSHTQFVLETAAVIHDIAICKAEELYGSSAGHYQEELGPALAEELLTLGQFGKTETLSSALLTKKRNVKVVLDPITGALLKVAE